MINSKLRCIITTTETGSIARIRRAIPKHPHLLQKARKMQIERKDKLKNRYVMAHLYLFIYLFIYLIIN